MHVLWFDCFYGVLRIGMLHLQNMKTKLQRESFLMLPASNLEKYVARLLMVSMVVL